MLHRQVVPAPVVEVVIEHVGGQVHGRAPNHRQEEEEVVQDTQVKKGHGGPHSQGYEGGD